MPESIYIQRQFMTFLGLDVQAEEIFFRVDDRDTDYVNTDMVLHRDRLLAVMQFLLDEVTEQNPQQREKCRHAEQVLTLWIRGLDALAQSMNDMTILPRTVSEFSGRVDRLLPGDPHALLSLPDEAFLRLTAQGHLMSGEQMSRQNLEATLPYWDRFVTRISARLAAACDYCLLQLSRLYRNLNTEPRQLRCFTLPFGRLELHMQPRDMSDCEHIMEYDDASVADYLEEVMAGRLTPVSMEARVIYRNDAEVCVFRHSADVIDVHHPHVSDWREPVTEALDWIRRERTSLVQSVPRRPVLKLAA
ncbi:hypothetical protein CE665_25235 [Salmonella enterica subsp. enterica serovar Poona]|uniref:Uncharacterized protein n=2 Tax=Salmonella enterica TaxID=28901 RepID=A0A505CM67_SALER|nr:hypothetical protein [Salmonella enterica]EBR3877496.1 hypothetical protein [Salmonella enterica subsp. arizonae]EBV1308279.1 hypothetical protein [Salmonella enterica subsp. enterica serovar Typhimurium]EBW3413534.1 hypothetical protein [Salmonella enterica subsp. enterica serovar Newport]EBX4721345.1 hypothetical protein [Salmonella enterica subsp. enterica serovar Rubislaw]EBY0803657.1 hypothetical protein [Salmonella enterica subsp. enterica serovar Berlin]ECA0180456.1 hypothetical pro